jgi:hypothetical protein
MLTDCFEGLFGCSEMFVRITKIGTQTKDASWYSYSLKPPNAKVVSAILLLQYAKPYYPSYLSPIHLLIRTTPHPLTYTPPRPLLHPTSLLFSSRPHKAPTAYHLPPSLLQTPTTSKLRSPALKPVNPHTTAPRRAAPRPSLLSSPSEDSPSFIPRIQGW